MISELVVASELKVVQFFLKCSKFAGDHNAVDTRSNVD
jgi:hypothetical protein